MRVLHREAFFGRPGERPLFTWHLEGETNRVLHREALKFQALRGRVGIWTLEWLNESISFT